MQWTVEAIQHSSWTVAASTSMSSSAPHDKGRSFSLRGSLTFACDGSCLKPGRSKRPRRTSTLAKEGEKTVMPLPPLVYIPRAAGAGCATSPLSPSLALSQTLAQIGSGGLGGRRCRGRCCGQRSLMQQGGMYQVMNPQIYLAMRLAFP
ncbi:hypothetical protein BS78_01G236600 [Paspalum vaginatum]|nr:hypothetical protein BS78_01G236600 [Paspalum vaginatum]